MANSNKSMTRLPRAAKAWKDERGPSLERGKYATHITKATDPTLLKGLCLFISVRCYLALFVPLLKATYMPSVACQTREDGYVECICDAKRDEGNHIKTHGDTPTTRSYSQNTQSSRSAPR
jgi:hypothetical protein